MTSVASFFVCLFFIYFILFYYILFYFTPLGLPYAVTLEMSIDSTLIETENSNIVLNEGAHEFQCFGTNSRRGAFIIWIFGDNIIPPTHSTIADSVGDSILSVITELQITEAFCDIPVTCAVVSCTNPHFIFDSRSFTVNLFVNGKFQGRNIA